MTAPYVPPPTLGWKPLVICPTFSLGEDWITTLDASAGGFVWPDGATVAPVHLRFPSNDTKYDGKRRNTRQTFAENR